MEEEQSPWMSPPSNSMLSTTLGRVMSNLLSARPKKLEASISRLDSDPKSGSFASLEESLRILHTYVRDAAQRNEALDGILVPMIENSLKHKESKLGSQAMILFNWLFQDEILFQAVVTNLALIIRRKEDHYIALGWCLLVRGLVECEITMNVFMNNGIRDNYCSLLKIFSSCITHLTSIVSNGSTLQGGFELPTRLSVAAADCILALTIALTKRDLVSDGSDDRPKPSNPSLSNLPISSVPAVFSEAKVKSISKSFEASISMEMKLLLWDHLDSLIILVQRLSSWNKKSRPLHAKGVERVVMWLQGIKGYYVHVQNEADGSQLLRTGVLLLSSCWKHYGMLMLLEDYKFSQQYKELLDQYLSGIEFYADNTVEHTENKDSGIETIKFFLNCLSLLLGHFDGKQLENLILEYGLRISRVLISQLHHGDEHVIDGAICILKAVIFRTNYALSRGSLLATREMDAVLPLLLHLLDERDGTARAVVTLIAEYCSISTDNRCIQEVLKRLASGDALQRRNAVDVISELFCISTDPVNINSWQDIANHLLERLGDEELEIRVQASNLIPMMDPSLVLPALIGLSYSSDEVVQSSACDTIVSVLKLHSKKYEVLCMLLDCLSNLCQNKDHPETSGGSGKGGSKLDADRVLKLIPQWSDSVEDWNLLIEPLIDKMFAEPSNAIIVRFLSCISEHLADTADVVFHRLLLHTRQKEESETKKYGTGSSAQLEHSLFDHLCPLLIIRLLPLRVFNDLNSSLMYGELRTRGNPNTGYFDINDVECVSGILLNRAFNKFEFEDVRKLAAELCGRIHPQVLLPIAASQLATAANAHDVLKVKTCLFSICTSFVIRGKDSILHPVLPKIRNTIEDVLLWPSLDGDDEVSKAQHGCIDCLALMICAELQAPESFISDLTSKKPRDGAVRNSVLSYVIYQLNSNREVLVSLSFRLCMANILISACQKVSDAGKKPFARKILPRLIRSAGVMMESEIRAACIQVFFSAVYYLKSAVLPYTCDLLSHSVKSLKEGSEKEKLAGAKLMAALMASEESVVESIAGGLLEARTLLSSISSADPSPEVRQMSQKLLACLTSI